MCIASLLPVPLFAEIIDLSSIGAALSVVAFWGAIVLIVAAVSACGLTAVQFSGSESPQDCDAAPVPVIKMVPIGMDFGLEGAEPYRDHAAALLLET